MIRNPSTGACQPWAPALAAAPGHEARETAEPGNASPTAGPQEAPLATDAGGRSVAVVRPTARRLAPHAGHHAGLPPAPAAGVRAAELAMRSESILMHAAARHFCHSLAHTVAAHQAFQRLSGRRAQLPALEATVPRPAPAGLKRARSEAEDAAPAQAPRPRRRMQEQAATQPAAAAQAGPQPASAHEAAFRASSAQARTAASQQCATDFHQLDLPRWAPRVSGLYRAMSPVERAAEAGRLGVRREALHIAALGLVFQENLLREAQAAPQATGPAEPAGGAQ